MPLFPNNSNGFLACLWGKSNFDVLFSVCGFHNLFTSKICPGLGFLEIQTPSEANPMPFATQKSA